MVYSHPSTALAQSLQNQTACQEMVFQGICWGELPHPTRSRPFLADAGHLLQGSESLLYAYSCMMVFDSSFFGNGLKKLVDFVMSLVEVHLHLLHLVQDHLRLLLSPLLSTARSPRLQFTPELFQRLLHAALDLFERSPQDLYF